MAKRKDIIQNASQQQGQQQGQQDDKSQTNWNKIINSGDEQKQSGWSKVINRDNSKVNAEKVLKESLEGESEPYLFSGEQIKNLFKGDNWFNTDFTKVPGNIWHTITDKDEDKGILDYSEYKHYKSALDNADPNTDIDAIYKQMANEGVIDYDKFTKRRKDNPDSKPVMSKYEQAISDIKTSFDNKLSNALSPYMSGVEGSYQLNAVTKAREEMYDQYEMFINSYAGTYKDTRDDKLLKDFNNILNEYEDSIIKFTTQWAKNLTTKNEGGLTAYYDTLNDEGMRSYANKISSIQAQAENKMTRAALVDSFEGAQEALKNFNMFGAGGEILRAALNTFNRGLDKVGNLVEQVKQTAWGGYDVVEELANLNVYSNDAGVLQRSFGTLASWAGEIIDGLPTVLPALIPIPGTAGIRGASAIGKVGKVSKATKIANTADEIIATIFRNKRNVNLLSKAEEGGILLGAAEGNTRTARFLKELMDDILLFDVSAQQFEGRPISDNDALTNMMFNIPIDGLIAKFSRGARYFSPDIPVDVLKADTISDDMLTILQKGKNWNKGQGKDITAMAEDVYMLASLEKDAPKKNIKMWTKEEISKFDGGEDLVNYINKVQEEASTIWNRLTTFQDVTNRDILLSAQSKIKNFKDKSVLQALDEATETLAVNNKVINALQNQVRLKSLYAYLKTLIVDGRVPKETFALVFDKVKLDGKGFKELVKTLLTDGTEQEFRNALAVMRKEGSNELSQSQIYNNFNRILGGLYKENPNIIQDGDIVGGYIKKNGRYYDIFNAKEAYDEDKFFENILPSLDKATNSINKDAFNNAIDKELATEWVGDKDVSNIFEGTKVKEMLDGLAPDQWEKTIDGNVEYVWRSNAKIVAVDELFKKLGLTLKVEGGRPIIYSNRKALTKIKNGLNGLRNFQNLSNMNSNTWATYKLLFADDYANQFDNIIKAIEATREGDEPLTKDFIASAAKNWNSPHENLYKKLSEEATKFNKAVEGREEELKEEFKNSEFGNKLSEDIINSLEGNGSATQVEATAAELDILNKTIEATDMDGLEDELMKFFTIEVDASTLNAADKRKKGLGDKNLLGKKVMIGKIPEGTARNIIKKARSVVENMTFEKADDKLKAFSVIGKWLSTLSLCPYTATLLSKQNDTFVNVLLSRILVNDEKATNVALNYMEKKIAKTMDVLDAYKANNKDIFNYNKGVMELRNGIIQMQNRIEAIKNYYQAGKAGIDMTGVKEQIIANVTKLNNEFFNREDFEAGKKIVDKLEGRVLKKFSDGKELTLSQLNDTDISYIADYLAKNQLEKSKLYSYKLYSNLRKGFEKGLVKAKELAPNSTFKIDKDGLFKNVFENDTSVFGIFNTARVLGNFSNEDLGATAIVHEIMHQDNIKGLSNYKQLHGNVGDLTERGRLLYEDEYLTKNMGGSFLNYVQELRNKLKQSVLEANKNGEFKNNNSFLYAYTNEYSRKEILDGIEERFGKDNLVNSLVERWSNFKLGDDSYNLQLGTIIDDEYITALEEIITEYRTMVALGDAGYKYANAPYVLQALNTLEKAAEVVDRFRILCVEDNRITHRTEEGVRKILSASFNNVDLRVNETFSTKLTDTLNKWIANDAVDGLTEGSARKYVKKLQSAFKVRYLPTSVKGDEAKQWALNALDEYKPKKGEELGNIAEVKEFIEELDGEETIQFLDAIDCIDMSVRDYDYETIKRLSQKPEKQFERFDTSRPSTGISGNIEHKEVIDKTGVYTDSEKELFKKGVFSREALAEYKKKNKINPNDIIANARIDEMWDDMETTMYISNWLLKNNTKENVGIKATISGMAQSLGGGDSGYIEMLNTIFKNTKESIDSRKLLVGDKTLKAFGDSNTNQDLSTFITNKIVANLLSKKGLYNQNMIDAMNNVMFIDNVNKAIADLSGWKGYSQQSNPTALNALIDILGEEYGLKDSIGITSMLTPGDINRFNSNVQAYLTSFVNSYSNEEIGSSALDTFGKKIADEFIKLVHIAEGVDNKRSYYLAFHNLLFGDEMGRKILDDETSEYLKDLLTKPTQKTVNGKVIELEPYGQLTEYPGGIEFEEFEQPFVNGIKLKSNLEVDEVIDAILPQIRKDKEKYKTTKGKIANRKYEQLQLLEDELLKEKNRPKSKAFGEGTSSKLTTKNDKFTKQQSLSLKQYNEDAKPYIDKINEVKGKLTQLEDEYNTLKNEEKGKWIEEERKRIRKALNTAEGTERTRLQKEWFNLENATPRYGEGVRDALAKMWNEIENLRFELDLQENKLDDINVHYQGVIDYRDLKGTEIEKGFYDKEGGYVQGDAVELLSEDSMLNGMVENDIGPKFIDRIIDKYTMKYSPIYNIVEDGISDEAKALRVNYAVFYNQISGNKGVGKKIDDVIAKLLEKNKDYEKAGFPSKRVIEEGKKRRYLQNIKDGLYVGGTTVDTANVRGIDNVIGTKVGGETIDRCIIVFSDGNSMVITKDGDKLRKEFTGGISKYRLAESMINSTAKDSSSGVLVRFARKDGKILEQKQLSKSKVWSSFVGQEVSKELGIYDKIQRDISKMNAKEFGDIMGIQNDWQGVNSISNYIDAIKQVGVKRVSLGGTAIEEVLYQDVLVAEREKIKDEITYLNMLLEEEGAKTTMTKEQMKNKVYLLEKNLGIVNNIMDDIKKDLPDSSWVKEEYESFKNKARTFTIEDVDKYFDENGNLWKAEPGKYEKTYVKYKKVGINDDGQIVPIKNASGNDSVEIIERKYNEDGIDKVRENTIFYYKVDKEGNPKELIRSEPWTNKRTVIGYRPSFDVISEDMGEQYIKEQGVYTKKIYQLNASNSEILEDLRARGEVQGRGGDYEFTRPELDMNSGELRLVMKNDLTGEEVEGILRDVPVVNQMYGTTYRLKEFTPVDKEIKFGNLQLRNALGLGKIEGPDSINADIIYSELIKGENHLLNEKGKIIDINELAKKRGLKIEEYQNEVSKELLEEKKNNEKLRKELRNLKTELGDGYKKDKRYIDKANEYNQSFEQIEYYNNILGLGNTSSKVKEPNNIIDNNSAYFSYSKGERRQYPGVSKYYINPNTNKLIPKGNEGEDMFEYAQGWFPYGGSTRSDVEKTINAAKNTRKGTLLDKDIVFRYENESKGIGDRGLEGIKLQKNANNYKVNAVKAADQGIISEGEAKKSVDAAKDIENMIKQSKQLEDDAANYAQNMFDGKEALNRLFALTNYDILGNSEYLQHIRGTRDMFISKNKTELENIVNKWDTIVGGLSQDEKNNIMDGIKEKINSAIQHANGDRIIEQPIKEPANNAEELINQFIGVFAKEGNRWYTDGILRMINDANSLEDIMYKLYFSDAISMIGLNADVHNIGEARDTIYNWVRNMVKTDKEAKQIASDFVGDPLGGGNTYKLMANVRSAARFSKYSILSPISGTIMFMNSALLSEPLLAGKKKIVASYLNDKTFNKILENEDLLSFLSRDGSIVENGNTDMSLKGIWMDNQLKKFANFISNPNSKTKLGQKRNKVVNTVMLGGWHSLYDLWRQGEVKKVAFAQALNELGIPETALPDLLAKINDGRIYSDPGLSRTWAQVMAKTEEFYARFFTNAGTQALSRHRFSRLYGFNFLQGYVINRTDEMIQGFRQLQKFINDAGIGNITWNDLTRHLAQDNQELMSFMNNVIASAKMGYYYEKISDTDSKRDNNLYGYFVASNDYLSSLDATWFYRLLSSPFHSIQAYKQYSDWAGEDATIGGGVKVATIKLFSDICSQFFREGKFLNAIRDTLVAYGQTGDLDFAATVAGVEWGRMANSLGRFGLVEGQEKYGLEDFSQNSDVIGQMLLATDKTTRWGKEQQDMYDITNVDSIINDEGGYTAMNVLGKLPLIGELLKSATGKGGFAFSEAKYNELMNLVENDKGMQELYKGKINTDLFTDEAINRIWSDFTAFNYPAKTLKSMGKHSVGSYIEGKDTTLNSMREDVFVQNICEKMGIDIEEFHNMISSDSAKTTGRLKVMAAAEAAEPGSGKIVLSYIMANDLYKLEQQYTNKQYPSTADIPDDVMIQLKKMVLEQDGNQMFTADKASWYKTIMEYVSGVEPDVFNTLYKNNTLTNYVNSVGFMDMLMWDVAQKGDINAAYIKNVFGVITKYMKNDDARVKAVEHLFNTIEELDAPQSVKNMAMQGTLAGNIDFYNRLKNSPILSTIYKDALDNFEHRIWGTLDTDIPLDNMYNKSYKKYTPYSSQYGDKNKKVNDDLTNKANQYFPKSSGNGNGAGYSVPHPYTTKNSIKPKDALDWYWKYYEGLIKDYSDKLVKGEGKKYPAQTIEGMTFKTGSNNRGSIKGGRLYFPKHKSKKYRTNVLSNLPGSHG